MLNLLNKSNQKLRSNSPPSNSFVPPNQPNHSNQQRFLPTFALSRGGSEPSSDRKSKFKLNYNASASSGNNKSNSLNIEVQPGSGQSTYIAQVSSRLLDCVNKVFISSSANLTNEGYLYKNRRSPKRVNVIALANQIVFELEIAKSDVYLLRAVSRQVHRYLSVFSSQLDPLLAMVCSDPQFISIFNPPHSPTQSQSIHLSRTPTPTSTSSNSNNINKDYNNVNNSSPSPPPPPTQSNLSVNNPVNNAQQFAFELCHTAWLIKNIIIKAHNQGLIPSLAIDLIKDGLDKLDCHVARVMTPTIKSLRCYLGMLAFNLRESYVDSSLIINKKNNGHVGYEFNNLPYHLKSLSKGMEASKKILIKLIGPCKPEGESWVAKVAVHLIWSVMLNYSVKKPLNPQLNNKQAKKVQQQSQFSSTDSLNNGNSNKVKTLSPTPIHSALGRVAASSRSRTPSPDQINNNNNNSVNGNSIILSELEIFHKLLEKFLDGLIDFNENLNQAQDNDQELDSLTLARSALNEGFQSLNGMKEFMNSLNDKRELINKGNAETPITLPNILALHLLLIRRPSTVTLTPENVWKWSWEEYAEGIGGFGGALRWQSAVFKAIENVLIKDNDECDDQFLKDFNNLIINFIKSNKI